MENIETILEQFPEPVNELLDNSTEQTNEEVVESSVDEETVEGSIEDGVFEETLVEESVSGGDSTEVSTSTPSISVEDIASAIDLNGTEVYVIQEYTIWDKPLEEYSVTEGLLLILVLCALGMVIHKVIGGVLNCSMLFKK